MNKKERKEKLKQLHIELLSFDYDGNSLHITDAIKIVESMLSAHGVFACTFKRTSAGVGE